MNNRSHNSAVYVISVAAELAGMHPQTLRIYERRGLVRPARTEGGNRRYSDADIEVLQRISDLTAEGMNVEGIRRVMELEAENARLRDELARAHAIAQHDANPVPLEPPREVAERLMTVVELDAEHAAAERLRDLAFELDFLLLYVHWPPFGVDRE